MLPFLPISVKRYLADKAVALSGGRLARFRPTHSADNRITDHWLCTSPKLDAAFAKATEAGSSMGPGTQWRVHVACWAAKNGLQAGGAFVECGVARGFMARVICDYINIDVPFYLLDTYEGFDDRYLSEEQLAGIRSRLSRPVTLDLYAGNYDRVVETFKDRPNVRVIKGSVPDTLVQVTEDKIGYLSIDMNCAIPEIEAIEYFWPKMVKGAFVVLDDYGWQGHDEQRLAFNDWSARTGVPILSMPTRQGLIVKQ